MVDEKKDVAAPPKGRIGPVVQEGKIAPVTARQMSFIKPNLQIIEQGGLTDEEKQKYTAMAFKASVDRANAIQLMGKLVARAGDGMTNAQLAEEHVRRFYRELRAPKERAIFELLRDPDTGVPPRDVRFTDYGALIVDN